LGHISFFGLGIVNLAFYLTAKAASLSPSTVRFAGWGFVIGAVSMPLCCLLMAHFPRTRPLFGVPVMSLLLAGSLVMVGLVHPRVPVSPRVPPVTSQSLTEEFPSRTYLVEVGPARRAGRSPESGRLGEPSLPSRDIDELSSRLDYIQCSNVSTLFRFNASTFNASTFRIP
jgi:hypothetical protein